MWSNYRVTSQRSYWDWTQDSYEYPDINDIIEQEERLREEKRAKKRGKKSASAKPMDAQNIKIRLVLGQFVSKEELKFLYQHSSIFEIAEMDRIFGGKISAAGLENQSERGIDHGYREGYTSDVVEVDGRRTIVMIPTSSPDLNVDANSVNKLHSVVDVLQNNIHEDFGQAVCCAIRKYPEDVMRALNITDAIGVRYESCKFMRVESSWDQRLDSFKVDVIVDVKVSVMYPSGSDNSGGYEYDNPNNPLLTYRDMSRHLTYRLRYVLDLYGKTGVKTCSGPYVKPVVLCAPDLITLQKNWRTTSYLRPIIWRKDFPKLIRRMLSEVYIIVPEKADNREEIVIQETVKVYPSSWAATFGTPILSIAHGSLLTQQHYSGDWDVLKPAKVIEEMNTLSSETLAELMEEAKAIMEGWETNGADEFADEYTADITDTDDTIE